MTTSYRGGCACGSLRYEANSEPVFQNHCKCRDCQKRSGTGHGSYMTFANRDQVSVTGVATEWKLAGDSGNLKAHAFCPICGTPVYLTFAAMPDFIAVHASSLDQPDRFKPQAVTYAIRAQTWDTMDASLAVFETMPG